MIYVVYPSQCPEEVKKVFEDLEEEFDVSRLEERDDISRYEFAEKSENILKDSAVFIAEASYPSSGVEIEAKWAHDNRISIILFVKQGKDYPDALKDIFLRVIHYFDAQDLRKKLYELLKTELPLESKKDFQEYTDEDTEEDEDE